MRRTLIFVAVLLFAGCDHEELGNDIGGEYVEAQQLAQIVAVECGTFEGGVECVEGSRITTREKDQALQWLQVIVGNLNAAREDYEAGQYRKARRKYNLADGLVKRARGVLEERGLL